MRDRMAAIYLWKAMDSSKFAGKQNFLLDIRKKIGKIEKLVDLLREKLYY